MTDLARDLALTTGVPVLDGVACAVSLAESLVRLDLKTSKRNTYAAPLAKAYAGEFKRFAPGRAELSGETANEYKSPRRHVVAPAVPATCCGALAV